MEQFENKTIEVGSKVCFTDEAFKLIPSCVSRSIHTVVSIEEVSNEKKDELLTIATLDNGMFANVHWLKLI